MKTYHLNCGTLRPWGLFPLSTIPLFNTGRLFRRGLGVIHCLLVDTGAGLLLIDSGYGTRDYVEPAPAVSAFNSIIGLQDEINQTALHHIRALGYAASDVKHILLTHMHLDHTGGLPDFPDAQIHVFAGELEAAQSSRGINTLVFRREHRAHNPNWQPHALEGNNWLGLPCTPAFTVCGVEAFFVPMTGHSPGHSLVVLRLPDERWIIHAGDAYGYHGQIDIDEPFFPPYHRFFRPLFMAAEVTRSLFTYDEPLRHIRRELGSALTIFCAHDPHEYQQLSGDDIITRYL